jgi:hypothetical protein
MIMSRAKDIGTRAETAVTRHARVNGFPDAERRALAGSADLGDVLLCRRPSVIVEVKGGASAKKAGAGAVAGWLAETERERQAAEADVGLLVVQRHNLTVPGPGGWQAWLPLDAAAELANGGARVDPGGIVVSADVAALQVARTPVAMTLDDVLRLLRWAGYGAPMPTPADALEGALEAVSA